MSKNKIGKLERLPLRDVWKHEALDFTHWLQENIDVLNDVLDLNLVNVDREQAAGSFSIDLVAEDGSGGTVVIENQLEKSNHDHLGKLITYLTAMGAKAAIWILSDPRPEHVAAITWLNESSSASFYMVKVEAVKIGDSPAAPLLTLIVGPSEEVQTVGQAKKEIAEVHNVRYRWWFQLIERSREINHLHAHITAGKYVYIGTSSGTRGINFNYTVLKNECGAEVYIDRGKGADEENEKIFDQLHANRAEIEKAFGASLKWERLEQKRACRIKITYTTGGYSIPEDKWPDIQIEIIKAMDRLEKAISPYISRLRL
jgi:hypothetical protein